MQEDKNIEYKTILPKSFCRFILKENNLNILTLIYVILSIVVYIPFIRNILLIKSYELLILPLFSILIGVVCFRKGLWDMCLESSWVGRGSHMPSVMTQYFGIDAVIIGTLLLVVSIFLLFLFYILVLFVMH
jgi:hypothetical protein